MKRLFAGTVVGIMMATSLPVLADRREERHGEMRHWEGREIHRFGERDFEIWRGGHWYHGRHEGHRGWWWVAAGVWYFYPSPVYPYPDPYIPPVTVIQQTPVVPAPQAPVMVAPQPSAQYWYYCESAKAYYPYVPSCAEGWKSVPAQPPAAPQ